MSIHMKTNAFNNPSIRSDTTNFGKPRNASSRKSSITILQPRDTLSQESYYVEEFEMIPNLERNKWISRNDFFIKSLALCLSLNNLSRFTKAAWLYGQGAFVLLYIIFTIFMGSTMYFFEIALGQFAHLGMLKVFSISPFFEGVGLSMALYCGLISTFYNVINVYSLLYTFATFNVKLPYSTCNNLTLSCQEKTANDLKTSQFLYFYEYVCKNNGGSEENDGETWRNMGLLFFLWFTILMALFRRFEKLKWPFYVYIIFYHVVLLTVLIVSLTMNGSANGLALMVIPDWKYFIQFETWKCALEQTILTLCVGLGPVITLSSNYNFQNPVHSDSIYLSCLTVIASLLIGGILFSTMGILANEREETVVKVMANLSSPSGFIVQIVYSHLFSRLPNGLAQTMNFLFFATFLISGWISVFMYFETTVFTIYVYIPMTKKTKIKVGFSACLIFCGVGFFMVNIQKEDEIIRMAEMLMIDYGLLLIILIEYIVVMYFYGNFAFCDNIEFMFGINPKICYQVVWSIVPILFTIFLIQKIVLEYIYFTKTKIIIVATLNVICFLPIVIEAIINTIQFKKSGKILAVFTPRILSNFAGLSVNNSENRNISSISFIQESSSF